jgi:hypothetical protein
LNPPQYPVIPEERYDEAEDSDSDIGDIDSDEEMNARIDQMVEDLPPGGQEVVENNRDNIRT